MVEGIVVSVIIPARNEQAFIRPAIESVASQTLPVEHLECIVVDNASEDDTAGIARATAESVPRLALTVIHEAVPGVGRAKNSGARLARGDILIFLDADSRMDPGLAEAVLGSYSSGWQAGSIKVRADSLHPVDRGFFALMELGKVWFGVRGQMMYCGRDLFLLAGGFDPALHLAEDLEFLGRVRAHLKSEGLPPVCHVRAAAIATSPRRLQQKPFHLNMIPMFARWALAFAGIGRNRKY